MEKWREWMSRGNSGIIRLSGCFSYFDSCIFEIGISNFCWIGSQALNSRVAFGKVISCMSGAG